jgi:parvulin-like peptidyl-prolyl isomerase
MSQLSVYRLILALLTTLLLSACGNESADKNSAQRAEPVDVIARVGDEVITYSHLNTLLSSLVMERQLLPAPGTPERKQIMVTLLDKVISANLVYLDAKKKGSDRSVSYTEDVKRFEDAMLATMYKAKVMIGDIPVGEVDVIHYYNTQTNKDMELTDEFKLAIEDSIRQQKYEDLESTLRERLRKNVEVVINEAILSHDYDNKRTDEDAVATYDKQPVTWSQIKELMLETAPPTSSVAVFIDSDEERLERLEQYIDNAIMTQKGREYGLEKDPVYIERVAEYRKALLINEHSNVLIHSWSPSQEELKSFYLTNMEGIVIPQARKVQMVVVKTKEEADEIRAKIDAGELTLQQAAQQYSIDPGAKRNLGDMGWVKQGAGVDALDKFIFELEPDVLSAPVESPAGWHLLKVLEESDAQFANFDDPQTQNRTLRAYMQSKFTDYIADLRKNQFKVVVYDDELNRQLQKEADDIAELDKKAEQRGLKTEQPVEELHQWMVKPAPE